MYLLIVSIVMGVLAVAHLVFAFATPPAALAPFVDGFSRRIRIVVSALPEKHQQRAARLLTGVFWLLGAGWAGWAWFSQL